MKPVVTTGILGWSNKRGGTEFYATQADDSNGRWAKRRTSSYLLDEVERKREADWGDLLVDDLHEKGASEGCDVVVVAVPRLSGFDIAQLEDRIHDLIDELS